MTINEAIRIGCRQYPRQAFGAFGEGSDGACVNGALSFGLHGNRFSLRMESLGRLAPSGSQGVVCPLCRTSQVKTTDGREYGYTACRVFAIMAHLNNDHRWTREAIAEWVDPHPELHIPMPRLMETPVVHA